MTIADNYEPIKQETNGVATQFSFDFYALSDAFIKVYLETDGVQTLVNSTDYEITFTENGGVVAFYDPPAAGSYIIITRDTPREQETPFYTSSGFPAKTVEGRLDKLTAMVQELQDDVDRSAKVPVGTNISPELPVPDEGKALVWDGNSLANSDETLQAISDKATGAYTYAQEAKGYRDQASASATLAEDWATKMDGPVADNKYSSRYYAENIGADVHTVADIATDVTAVAGNEPNITTCANNIVPIQNASTNAEIASTSAQAAADSAALAYQYGNDKINQTHITNCITEIPQDIKLELSSGTLTLKSGSKVYIPNGFELDGTTPKFDEVIINTDLSRKPLGNTNTMFIFYNYLDNSLTEEIGVSSGSTISPPGTYHTRYDTTINKIIRSTDGSTWSSSYQDSFPIAYVTADATDGIVKINNAFNGFGYIGSTVFALPGVKGLIPNGRNDDGTLKNVEFTVSNVLTETNNTGDDNIYVVIDQNGLYRKGMSNYTYNEEENKNKYLGADELTTPICWHSRTSGVVFNFTPKSVFHALDWNDKNIIAGWGMPGSNKYIDLTLGATSTNYIAPANGWFSVGKTSTAANQYINMYIRIGNTNVGGFGLNSVASGQTTRLAIPCFKGNKIQVSYSMDGSSTYDYFRFIYAKGDDE